MEESSDSMVKEDYLASPGNPEGEPEPIKPVEKKYGTKVEPSDRWKDVKLKYEINIKPDKNGRMKF